MSRTTQQNRELSHLQSGKENFINQLRDEELMAALLLCRMNWWQLGITAIEMEMRKRDERKKKDVS